MPTAIGSAAFEDFARIARTGFLLIDESTSLRSLARELGWNAACFRLARGIRPPRGPRPAFQVSGRSLSDALEQSMITYREVVMAAICARGCQGR